MSASGLVESALDAADLAEKSEAEGRKLRRASNLSRSLIDGGRVLCCASAVTRTIGGLPALGRAEPGPPAGHVCGLRDEVTAPTATADVMRSLSPSQVPVVDGPVLLLALDGPLLAGAVRGPDPVHPRKQNHRGGAESVRRAHSLLTEFKSGTARPGQSRQCARRDRGGRSLRPLADSDAARPGAGKPPIVLVIVEALQRTRPPSMRERLYVDARRSFRPSASLFSARSAASTADSTRPSPARTRHPLDNVTPIGDRGAVRRLPSLPDPRPICAY